MTQISEEQMAKTFQQPGSAVSWTDFRNDEEQARHDRQWAYSWPHMSPGSVLVCPIGTTWVPGAWQRVVDMVMYARGTGMNVWLEEVRDSCSSPPYEAVGSMRDMAVQYAQVRGFEFVCLLENDVLPQPDLLANLVARDVAAIGPAIVDPNESKQFLGYPTWERGSGCKPMRWIPYTFMLFKTAVFNCFGAPPFSTFAEKSEATLSLGLARYGHRILMDTDNVMEVGRPPSYRDDSYADYIERMHRVDKARREAPDRSPVDPATPTIAGMYAPWWTKKQREEVEA